MQDGREIDLARLFNGVVPGAIHRDRQLSRDETPHVTAEELRCRHGRVWDCEDCDREEEDGMTTATLSAGAKRREAIRDLWLCYRDDDWKQQDYPDSPAADDAQSAIRGELEELVGRIEAGYLDDPAGDEPAAWEALGRIQALLREHADTTSHNRSSVEVLDGELETAILAAWRER